MTFRYDKTVDVLDIELIEGVSISRTEQLDSGTLVDLDIHGRVVSIEIIAPARAWPLDKIIDRFEISEQDQAVLRSLWSETSTYPFAETATVGAEAATA